MFWFLLLGGGAAFIMHGHMSQNAIDNTAAVFARVAAALIAKGVQALPHLASALPPITFIEATGEYHAPDGTVLPIGTVMACRINGRVAQAYGTSGQVVTG